MSAQLGVPLPRLLDRTCAGECSADVLAHERQEILVLCGVLDVLRVRLDGEDANGPPFRLRRDAEPADVLRAGSDERDLASFDQLLVPLVTDQLRRARTEDVRRRPHGVALAERVPLVGVRDVVVDLVGKVRPTDQLPFLVVERDEEVVGYMSSPTMACMAR